ncbi:MAG: TolC family protein [Candidatus Cloacimonetes bacterium]|nr:TolC family protein [Candidatus Cloacimonadota bacterium]
MRHLAMLLFMVLAISLNSLSLQEARQISLNKNPDLLAEVEADKASKNSLWNNYLNLVPSASLSGGYTQYEEEIAFLNTTDTYDGVYSCQLVVNQPIFNGGKLWLGAAISRDSYKIANESLKSSRLKTLNSVEDKYFSVLKNKALLEIAKKNLQTSQTNTEIAKVKYETGSLSKAGYLQMRAEQASKEVDLIKMETHYQTTMIDLANFLSLEKIEDILDIPSDDHQLELQILQETNFEKSVDIVSEILLIGKKHNPALKISELSIKTSNKSLLLATGNFLPTINLQYMKSWSKYNFEADFNNNVGQIGINVSVPIFPLVNNGLKVAVARNNMKKAKYSFESTRKTIELSMKSSVLNLISAAKTVNSSQMVLEYSRETYEQMKERFANGLITANELLSSEIMYNSAQNQAAIGFYDYLSAKSYLLSLMGTEDEEVLNKILNTYGGNK